MDSNKLNKEIPRDKLKFVIIGLAVLGFLFGAWFMYETYRTADTVKDIGGSIEANRDQ